MICPKCGREMEQGHVAATGGPGLFFVPSGVKWNVAWSLSYNKKSLAEKGVQVLDGPYLTRFNKTELSAYLCRSCRITVMRY